MSFDVRIRTPSTNLIVGPTSSGKTVLAQSLIRHKEILFHPVPQYVIWLYSEQSSLPNQLIQDGLIHHYQQGYESYEQLRSLVLRYSSAGVMLFLDDGASYFHQDFAKIFREMSHHLSCTVFLITQQLFVQNKHYRSLTLNCQNLFLMKNPRDSSFIHHLERQYSPYQLGWLVKAYLRATRKPHSYLYFSFHQKTSDVTRVLSRLLPDEPKPVIVYIKN